MTANGTGTPANAFASILEALKGASRIVARIAIGGLAIVAAAIVAMTAALLGLLIAFAALIFRFSPKRSVARPTHRPRKGASDDGIVLEAHKTGQGWTVE